ncbi:MAG TPA: heavy metal translocating P-type ATPase [Candidatus Dormibacteraeota bacterium]
MAQLPVVALGLAVGGALRLADLSDAADAVWGGATAVSLLPLTAGAIRDLLRRRFGVDVIALLAMAGALALGEFLAAAVIALMMSGGQALEAFADRRARSELSSLVSRAPRMVHRYEGERLASPPLDSVVIGDRLLVKTGEVIPVDGVSEGAAVLDESALTGESRPVERAAGDVVRSGALNIGPAFDLRAMAGAEDSTYASIVRLVREAQASRAPMVRLADRYSLVFLAVTLALAAVAWVISGRPERALAVLVVATPCPLILAAPIAIVAGISRAAAHGVVVKGGAALEALARARIALFDKTGTLTLGAPRVLDVRGLNGVAPDEALRLAASLDQVSTHVFAGAVVAAARERGLALSFPTAPAEVAGAGISGQVDGRRVRVGRASWVTESRSPQMDAVKTEAAASGTSNVFIAVDGKPAAALVLEDPLRTDAAGALRDLREAGITEIDLLTGDRLDVARRVAERVGADRVIAESTPEQKLAEVAAARTRGVTLMVGDGINDAPALAAADIGVAIAVRGETASSDAAAVVLLVDRIQCLAEALRIARRARSIALQSIVAGMVLSSAAMVAAALGYIPPLGGALLQEGIDVLVILNALRALSGGRRTSTGVSRAPALQTGRRTS